MVEDMLGAPKGDPAELMPPGEAQAQEERQIEQKRASDGMSTAPKDGGTSAAAENKLLELTADPTGPINQLSGSAR